MYVSERVSVDHEDRWVIHSQLSLQSMRIEVANRHHHTSMGYSLDGFIDNFGRFGRFLRAHRLAHLGVG
jgi:hypothetical protein